MNYAQSRRMFLAASAAGLGFLGRQRPGQALAPTESAADLVRGKDSRLLVLKDFPPVLETPLKLLTQDAVTPGPLLFVRNNSQPENAATMDPMAELNWNVRFTGALNRSLEVTVAQLRNMPATEYEMVLQCSGNGRALFSKAAPTSGTQWGRGGMGNVRFSGIPLSAVLQKFGVDVQPGVQFVNASGTDEPLPGDEKFLHSLPLEDVMNRSILALDLNGQPIPAIHGGPVRLITPGIFGTMQIKWLRHLDFVTEETTNYNHVPRYRVPHQPIAPGTEYKFTLQNSSYNWKMKTKSVILTPNDGDQLTPGRTVVQGVAFNDGAAAITDVLISVDRGQTWRRSELRRSDSAYGWTRFHLSLQLERGPASIWSCAMDELGRSQPVDGSIAWNPRGYEWNGIEKLDVVVG